MWTHIEKFARADEIVMKTISRTLSATVCEYLEKAGIAAKASEDGVQVRTEDAMLARLYLAAGWQAGFRS